MRHGSSGIITGSAWAVLGLLIYAGQTFGEEKAPERATGNAGLLAGDIVFQDSSPHSGQGEAIKALTRSQWSHCGIYFSREGGRAVVIDGNGKEGAVDWETWRLRGDKGTYAAYRLRNALSAQQVEKLWGEAVRLDQRPYDKKFAWGEQEIYCSELVWKAFHKAFQIEVGQLQRLRDFDLRSPLAKLLIERPDGWGTVANAVTHGDEIVVSPEAIAKSELLARVH